jgi:hypothetical protein
MSKYAPEKVDRKLMRSYKQGTYVGGTFAILGMVAFTVGIVCYPFLQHLLG